MLNIVFVGSVDHGKSTLIGRLLYDTNSLPEERIKEVKQAAQMLGKEFEFAYILDALEEERKNNITIDTTQIFFRWKGKEYCIIDAPGHKEFLKNMLTGATKGNTAVLLVSAKEGIEEQTRRHALLLTLVGIKKIIVTVNKMDAVEYSKERFEEVKKAMKSYLRSIGAESVTFVPISALNGDNVVNRSKNMPWWNGPTLIEILQQLEAENREFPDFRMFVQDVYKRGDEKIIAGNVCAGSVCQGDEIRVYPGEERKMVLRILSLDEIKCAKAPKAIGLVLDNPSGVDRGVILAKGSAPRSVKQFEAWLFAIAPIRDGEYTFRCVTQERQCRLEILEKLNLTTLKTEPVKEIENGDVARVRIVLGAPAYMETYSVLPELGKFTIERDGEVLGGGILQ